MEQRKKVPLKAGHSLMDWLTLCRANKNLSGVTGGGNGGRGRPVTLAELRQHKTVETQVWTALEGNVFNITPYLEFHPGGVDELMKGAGRDCTLLFRKKHAWVNYGNFLSSCYIGPLVLEEKEAEKEGEDGVARSDDAAVPLHGVEDGGVKKDEEK